MADGMGETGDDAASGAVLQLPVEGVEHSAAKELSKTEEMEEVFRIAAHM